MPYDKHNSPKKKKKSNWISRLKEDIRLLAKGPKHSPAGKKHMKLRYREDKHPALGTRNRKKY